MGNSLLAKIKSVARTIAVSTPAIVGGLSGVLMTEGGRAPSVAEQLWAGDVQGAMRTAENNYLRDKWASKNALLGAVITTILGELL